MLRNLRRRLFDPNIYIKDNKDLKFTHMILERKFNDLKLYDINKKFGELSNQPIQRIYFVGERKYELSGLFYHKSEQIRDMIDKLDNNDHDRDHIIHLKYEYDSFIKDIERL